MSKLKISSNTTIDAFALIADINGFTGMVSRSEGNLIAQFVRDVLSGPIHAVEEQGGEIVGFMGDAVLGILPDADTVAAACFRIAKDLNEQCEYISVLQESHSDTWPFMKGGPSIKIGVEYGTLDTAEISSNFLGEHVLLIGDAINYAARILVAGSGNRCLVGPEAASRLSKFPLEGPLNVKGKSGEPDYQCYRFDMSHIWIEGKTDDDLTYWP